MKVTEFAVEVSKQEGKMQQLSIAQIMEVIKIVNRFTGGELYKMIREMVRA